MIKRFIDDINGIFESLPPRTVYQNGEINVNNEEIEEDKVIENDVKTMKIIQKIANEIDSMIQMTVDAPSLHNDKKLPVLDMKVWMTPSQNLSFQFYEKEMKTKKVISKLSALSMKDKMTILTQEAFRRLHNTKEDVDEEVKTEIIL